MDLGLFIVRFVVGALFIGHGTQKLFGWFEGPGIRGTEEMVGSLGYTPRAPIARLAGLNETLGGAALMLGFLTPLAAAAIIGMMVSAIVTVHWPRGMWVTNGGMEYTIVLATVAAALAFVGPGTLSLDAAFGWDLSGVRWGIAAIALGTAGAFTLLAIRRTPAAKEMEEEATRQTQRRTAA